MQGYVNLRLFPTMLCNKASQKEQHIKPWTIWAQRTTSVSLRSVRNRRRKLELPKEDRKDATEIYCHLLKASEINSFQNAQSKKSQRSNFPSDMNINQKS